jgi:iron complex transport system permease protein
MFLILADTVARTIVAPAQLPVGVITALMGGPFFLVLLIKYSRKVYWLA